MFLNKLPQLSLFFDPTQFTSSSHTKFIKINFSRLSSVVAEAWASFVSTEYRTKVRFVIILYMCIETTLICIETTCIETTLYRNDQIPVTRSFSCNSMHSLKCFVFQ